MGSLTDSLKLTFEKKKKTHHQSFPSAGICKCVVRCQLMCSNGCQRMQAETKQMVRSFSVLNGCIWLLSRWVMLIVLSSIIGQSVKCHQVGLRSLSQSFPSTHECIIAEVVICHSAARVFQQNSTVSEVLCAPRPQTRGRSRRFIHRFFLCSTNVVLLALFSPVFDLQDSSRSRSDQM